MSIERARAHLARWGKDGDILEMEVSTATVALAAAALGVEPARIAKTLSLKNGEEALLIVAAGDAKLSNSLFRGRFGFKPRMLSSEEALRLTGHAVGGVCPFGLPEGTRVYMDVSLKRFETVFPACGSGNTAIELTLPELEECAGSLEWVEVCELRKEP